MQSNQHSNPFGQQSPVTRNTSTDHETVSVSNSHVGHDLSSSSVHHSRSYDVRHEITKLIKQTDELIEKLPTENPDHKIQIKKLKEIKKFLTKKTEPSSSSFFSRMRSNSQHRMVHYGEDNNSEASPSEILYFDDHHEPRQEIVHDLVNMNLDDSILHAVDDLITIFNFCKDLVSSK